MLLPLGLLTSLLTIAVALLSSAAMNQEMAKVEWTLEWWFTFPVPARSLLLSRALETAFVNPLAWFMAFPFFTSVFLCAGHGLLAPLLGIMATVYLGLLAGALRVAAETGLRRYLALRNVARIQAALSVIGTLGLMTTVLGSASPDLVTQVTKWAARLPAWTIMNPLNPMGLASRGAVARTAVACLGFGVLAVIGATRLGGWFVRDGLTTSTGPHEGSRGAQTTGAEPRLPLGAIARKELLLLSRDRNRLAQVFLSPILVLGTQFVLNRQFMTSVFAEPRRAASAAFVASGFALTTGGLQTLAADAPALWLYFTVPKRIERLFAPQALFWAALVSPIALGVFVAFTSMRGAAIMKQASLAAFLLVGVTLQAFIVTALGVFGTDVLDSDPRRRVRPSIVYLSMLLVGIFAYAIYTPSLWSKVAHLVLFSLLVYALWQKVADHASLLLDPNEVPPPRLAVGDGVIAALAFFVGQAVFGFILVTSGVPMAISSIYAFTSSGLLVGAVALYTLWRSGMPDVARAVGLIMPRGKVLVGLATGIATGLLTALFARGYQALVNRFEMLSPLRRSLDVSSVRHAGALPWIVALVTIAAPIFEEFIFRGLLYGGFRRSVSPLRAALASALVFAVVHPVGSSFPVFVMGLAAALVYGRFRSLLVPIAVHMTYNALIVASALLL
jgi:membrane protease YdiL (CAAX protease family)